LFDSGAEAVGEHRRPQPNAPGCRAESQWPPPNRDDQILLTGETEGRNVVVGARRPHDQRRRRSIMLFETARAAA